MEKLPRDLTDQRLDTIYEKALEPLIEIVEWMPLVETRDLHLTTRDTDHSVCFELRPQLTSVWCVAASVQMLLEFYRYEYSQVRVADELGLGTIAVPYPLPYGQEAKVVTVLHQLTSNALTAQMNWSPTWNEFKSEIQANRPLISFVTGHSRAVAGYTEAKIAPVGHTPFRGLLVYDPWAPNVGTITRWENFDAPPLIYRVTFTAAVTLV
jgi:hypothetical protein